MIANKSCCSQKLQVLQLTVNCTALEPWMVGRTSSPPFPFPWQRLVAEQHWMDPASICNNIKWISFWTDYVCLYQLFGPIFNREHFPSFPVNELVGGIEIEPDQLFLFCNDNRNKYITMIELEALRRVVKCFIELMLRRIKFLSLCIMNSKITILVWMAPNYSLILNEHIYMLEC